MKKKLFKYIKIFVSMALILSLVAPSYASLSASDGSAFVTKAEFDSALADFNARLTTFEAGINSKIDSQVTSYLDRNGIWSGKAIDTSALLTETDSSHWKNADGSNVKFMRITWTDNTLSSSSNRRKPSFFYSDHGPITIASACPKTGLCYFALRSAGSPSTWDTGKLNIYVSYNSFGMCNLEFYYVFYNETITFTQKSAALPSGGKYMSVRYFNGVSPNRASDNNMQLIWGNVFYSGTYCTALFFVEKNKPLILLPAVKLEHYANNAEWYVSGSSKEPTTFDIWVY